MRRRKKLFFFLKRISTIFLGGVWEGVCIDSLGKCRTTMGEEFVSILAVYHVFCLLAGMRMCYKVRNLPSIMADGKWVFTGFYSQLQVFVTAVPVLVITQKNVVTFNILKSLVICASDLTTLGMVRIISNKLSSSSSSRLILTFLLY